MKKSRIFCLIAAIVFLTLLGLVLRFGLMASPAIIVSKDTTWLTEPLNDNGLPDYGAWYIQQRRKGVTPENNGAIPFLQAMWPARIPIEERADVCAALGMRIPEDSKFQTELIIGSKTNPLTIAVAVDLMATFGLEPPQKILSYEQFRQWEEEWSWPDGWSPSDIRLKSSESLEPNSGMNQDFLVEALEHLRQFQPNSQPQPPHQMALDLAFKIVLSRCLKLPWNRQQFPHLAKRIESLDEPYQQLHAAARRTHFFFVTYYHDTQDLADLIFQPVDVFLAREAFRWLLLRGNLYLGDGDLENAWLDCQTLYQLVNRLEGVSIVQFLVAAAGYGMAHHLVLQILNHPEIDKKLAREIFNFLDSRPDHRDLSTRLDIFERLFALKTIMGLVKERSSSAAKVLPNQQEISVSENAILHRVDWNVVLREVNDQFDQLVVIAKTEDFPTKRDAYQEWFSSVEMDTSLYGFNPSFFFSQNTISLSMAERLSEKVIPNMRNIGQLEHQSNSDLRLMRTAAAIEYFRLVEGKYPAILDEVVGQLIQEIPIDDFHRLPLIYRPIDGGYVLYTVGANGVDDGGYGVNEDDITYDVHVTDRFSDGVMQSSALKNTKLGLPADFSIPEDADDRLIRFVRQE